MLPWVPPQLLAFTHCFPAKPRCNTKPSWKQSSTSVKNLRTVRIRNSDMRLWTSRYELSHVHTWTARHSSGVRASRRARPVNGLPRRCSKALLRNAGRSRISTADKCSQWYIVSARLCAVGRGLDSVIYLVDYFDATCIIAAHSGPSSAARSSCKIMRLQLLWIDRRDATKSVEETLRGLGHNTRF